MKKTFYILACASLITACGAQYECDCSTASFGDTENASSEEIDAMCSAKWDSRQDAKKQCEKGDFKTQRAD